MNCTNCGKPLEESSKFCNGCGTKLETDPVAQEQVAPVQVAPVTPEQVAPVEAAPVAQEQVAPAEAAPVAQEQVAPVEAAPVAQEQVAPVQAVPVAQEQPIQMEQPQTVQVVQPQTVQVAQPQTVQVAQPQTVQVVQPQTVQILQTEPIPTEKPAPKKNYQVLIIGAVIAVLAIVFLSTNAMKKAEIAKNEAYLEEISSSISRISSAWSVIVNASYSLEGSEFSRGYSLLRDSQSSLVELKRIVPPKAVEELHAIYVAEEEKFLTYAIQVAQEGADYYNKGFISQFFASKDDLNNAIKEVNSQVDLLKSLRQELEWTLGAK